MNIKTYIMKDINICTMSSQYNIKGLISKLPTWYVVVLGLKHSTSILQTDVGRFRVHILDNRIQI